MGIKPKTQELIVREAIPDDATALLAYLKAVATESNYLLVTKEDYAQSVAFESLALADIYDSVNNTLLIALLGQQLVGMIRIAAEEDAHICHIGRIGISVRKQYWGQKIGTALMADGIQWAKETHVLHRLELTVQACNIRGLKLYQKFGFKIEGTMPQGYYSKTTGFVDVLMMGLLI